MLEYVYKLNLPPVTEYFKDTVDNMEDLLTDTGSEDPNRWYKGPKNIQTMFNPITLKGLRLNKFLLFFKTEGSTGPVHVEDLFYIKEANEPCQWAINWVYQGHGTTEYWNTDHVNSGVHVKNTATNTAQLFDCVPTVATPDKTYHMQAPNAYLVNTSVPHRVTGYDNKYTFSLRPQRLTLTWNQVVSILQEYIVV
jgi:hypothetical protein